MGETLDLLAHRRIGGLPQPGSSIACGPGHRDENVGLRPVAFSHHLAQLSEVDLKLCGAVAQKQFLFEILSQKRLQGIGDLVAGIGCVIADFVSQPSGILLALPRYVIDGFLGHDI